MLNDAKGFSRIIIACGRTDLRRGIDGLAAVVQEQFQLDPTEKSCLLFFDRFYTQNAAYSGTDFSPSFSPKFLSESRTE